MRIVVLTAGGPAATRFLRSLRALGVTPAAVIVETRSRMSECFHYRRGARRWRELPLVPFRAVWRRVRPLFRSDLRTGGRIVVTGALNSARMRKDLERLAPDLLVLAGCGLLGQEVLQIPRLGAVNAHPGLLPWLRGNGVVGHALLREVAVGVTVHRVDAGIDTGPVLRRRLVAIGETQRTLHEIEAAANEAAAMLLADVVAESWASGGLAPGQPQHQRFPLCRWLDAAGQASAAQAVADGSAARLFLAWTRHTEGPGSLELPQTYGLLPRSDTA